MNVISFIVTPFLFSYRERAIFLLFFLIRFCLCTKFIRSYFPQTPSHTIPQGIDLSLQGGGGEVAIVRSITGLKIVVPKPPTHTSFFCLLSHASMRGS
jgi:hypothetical protein